METKNEKLGKKVQDQITRFEGIAITKCIYLNGCVQYSVQPLIDEKGEIPKEVWIDDQQLKIIGEATVKVSLSRPSSGGGSRNHPPYKLNIKT